MTALKLLQPAPPYPALRVLIDGRTFFLQSGESSPAVGVGPWRGFIGPTSSEFGYMSLKGRVGFNPITGLHLDTPQRGPYEASEGICPGRGRQKKEARGNVWEGVV